MRLIRPILAALTLFSAALWAEPVSQLHPSNYVNDFAHVLNTQTEDQLNSICEQLDHQAKAQVAVVTVNTLEGQDVESYAVDLFHKWGIGSKSDDHGVLILLAIQDHRGRIEVGYELSFSLSLPSSSWLRLCGRCCFGGCCSAAVRAGAVDTAAAADGVEAVLVAEAAEVGSEALAAAPPVAVVRALVGEEKQWHTRQSLTNLSKR